MASTGLRVIHLQIFLQRTNHIGYRDTSTPPFKNNNKKRHNNSGWRVKPILNDFMPRPQHLVETILYRCEDPTPTVEIRLCHLGVKTCRLWALCIRTF